MTSSKNYKDIKKIKHIISDLKVMAEDLGEHIDDKIYKVGSIEACEKEIKVLIEQIRHDSELLLELKKKHGMEYRDVQIITLKTDIRNNTYKVTEKISALQVKIDKSEKKKTLKENDIKYHNEVNKIMSNSLKLINESINYTSTNDKITKTVIDNCMNRQKKVNEYGRERDAIIKEKRDKRSNKKKQIFKNSEIELDNFTVIEVVEKESEEVESFMYAVNEKRKEQDVLLDEIGRALDDIKDISNIMNKQLTGQKKLLEDLEDGIDGNIIKLKSANKQLKDILEQSGGATRWVPVLILTIALIAVTGTIIPMITI